MRIILCILIIVLGVPLGTLVGGVYRHDTRIEKYLEVARREEFNCVGQVLRYHSNDATASDRMTSTLQWVPDGSCILIDSMHILSAAHCFIGEHTKDTVIDFKGNKVSTYITTGRFLLKPRDVKFFVMNQLVSAKKIVCHPDYLKYNRCDIAIITLAKPIRGAVTILLNKQPDEIHDTVTGVGYGVSGPANEVALVKDYSIKLAGQNIIDSIGGAMIDGINSTLYADFDSPDNRINCSVLGGDSKALELEYGISGGDSGSPLFRMKNSRLELIGIASGSAVTMDNFFVNGYYCAMMSWTRIAALYSWITSNK